MKSLKQDGNNLYYKSIVQKIRIKISIDCSRAVFPGHVKSPGFNRCLYYVEIIKITIILIRITN